MFHCSHPNAFFQSHLHPRGCPGVFLLGLGFQGCSGACSTPFSRLLQPSVRGVVDLGVMAFGHHPLPSPSLCGRVTLSVGVHSVYAPVGESGRLLASFDLREAYIPVPVHPASCPFLRFLFRDTVSSYRLCTLASPRLRRSSPGSWLLFQLYSILWVSVCVDPSTHGRSSFWDCHPSQVFQPHTFPGSAVSVSRLRFHLFQGFSVGGSHLSAAICNRRIYVLRLAYCELVAVASRRSFFTSSPSSGRLAFFLRWLASFLAATWDCSPSSSASIVPGTVRIWRLNSWHRWSVFTVSSGGSFSLVSLSACLCTKCLLSFTFGQMPRTWVGAPISTVRSLRACRTPVRQRCLSLPGNC